MFIGNNRRSGGLGFTDALITGDRVHLGDFTASACNGVATSAASALASITGALSGPVRLSRSERTLPLCRYASRRF